MTPHEDVATLMVSTRLRALEQAQARVDDARSALVSDVMELGGLLLREGDRGAVVAMIRWLYLRAGPHVNCDHIAAAFGLRSRGYVPALASPYAYEQRDGDAHTGWQRNAQAALSAAIEAAQSERAAP